MAAILVSCCVNVAKLSFELSCEDGARAPGRQRRGQAALGAVHAPLASTSTRAKAMDRARDRAAAKQKQADEAIRSQLEKEALALGFRMSPRGGDGDG